MESNLFAGAARLKGMPASLIRRVLDRAAELEARGRPIVKLIAGEPDFNTPRAIKDAAADAIRDNFTHYTSNRGYPPLRGAIAERVMEETGLSYDPDSEILVTTSGAEAINNSLLANLDPGDEVLIFSPSFINYENVARIAGATPVFLPLRAEDGFQIDVDALREKLTPRTRMVVLNNPCNPTGALYSPETLEKLSRLICERDLLAFSDEIYSSLTYEGRFRSLASFPGMRERTIVMNGFSKVFAMTGWRLGYVCADARMVSNILQIHQYSTTCSPTFVQVALAKTMNTEPVRLEAGRMAREFSKRRETVTGGLARIPGLRFTKPGGAFYVFADVSATGLSGEAFCARLLEESGVAVVPGVGFGREYGGFIRISYAAGDEAIAEGLVRTAKFVASLSE